LPDDQAHNIGKFAGEVQQELTMKRLAFATSLCAFALLMAAPARADYAVVQFEDGWCQVWWDSAATPWGTTWRKLVIGLPTWSAAHAALADARAQAVCRD
jgi:hypothetical protein